MKLPRVLVRAVLPITFAAVAHGAPAGEDDPFLWLEEVEGARALDWVKAQNARTQEALAGTPEFRALQGRLLGILDSKERIPAVEKIGAHYYNFWKDAAHPRGLWRRTTLDEYRKADPAWETVLDLDALGKTENVSWVWKGAEVLAPENRRCLVSLSRGGADATEVREFDLGTRRFVPGGFRLPESKSSAGWAAKDRLYVGLAFDSTTMTTSGYPRRVVEWKRGTPLDRAKPVAECEADDVAIVAWHDATPGFERDFVERWMTFFTSRTNVFSGGKLIPIEKPDDAEARAWREWLLFKPRTAWTVGGVTHPAGSLLAARFDDWLAGKRELTAVFTPGPRTSLDSYATTRSGLLVQTLDNVRSRLFVARPGAGGWTLAPVAGLPEFATLWVSAVDDLESDDCWIMVSDFLTPSTLTLRHARDARLEPLKHSPSFFDASRAVVTQHEAVSQDGTRIPYFQVSPKGLALDGRAPTLLYGYGGFEISEVPYYSGTKGAGWIERGGVYVLANIRGGGEFGPDWHQAAIREKRQRCYEDFSAVARDLIERRVTAAPHLACSGASNGGLLTGNMITQYPELFGAVDCGQPLLDMKRYSKLLAGASWMGEYGDPDVPSDWEFMKAWSPYHNLKKGVTYPPTLFTTSTRDDRVHPGHARKMAARMLELGADVLYYENIEGGHAGAADNPQLAYLSALTYTFLWRRLAPAP